MVPKTTQILSFDRPVRRHLVHRRAISEVFITDAAPDSGGQTIVAAQWPRRHWYFGSPQEALKLPLVIETLRQACLYLGYTQFGVPMNSELIIDEVRAELKQRNTLTGLAPVEIAVHITSRIERDHDKTPRLIRLQADYFEGPQLIASASGRAIAVAKPIYERLQPPHRYATIDHSPGSIDGLSPISWECLPDTTHPVFFDHPSDHIPGMMLIDWATTISHSASDQSSPRRVEAKFENFLDLTFPTLVTQAPIPSGQVLTFVQADKVGAVITLTLHQP